MNNRLTSKVAIPMGPAWGDPDNGRGGVAACMVWSTNAPKRSENAVTYDDMSRGWGNVSSFRRVDLRPKDYVTSRPPSGRGGEDRNCSRCGHHNKAQHDDTYRGQYFDDFDTSGYVMDEGDAEVAAVDHRARDSYRSSAMVDPREYRQDMATVSNRPPWRGCGKGMIPAPPPPRDGPPRRKMSNRWEDSLRRHEDRLASHRERYEDSERRHTRRGSLRMTRPHSSSGYYHNWAQREPTPVTSRDDAYLAHHERESRKDLYNRDFDRKDLYNREFDRKDHYNRDFDRKDLYNKDGGHGHRHHGILKNTREYHHHKLNDQHSNTWQPEVSVAAREPVEAEMKITTTTTTSAREPELNVTNHYHATSRDPEQLKVRGHYPSSVRDLEREVQVIERPPAGPKFSTTSMQTETRIYTPTPPPKPSDYSARHEATVRANNFRNNQARKEEAKHNYILQNNYKKYNTVDPKDFLKYTERPTFEAVDFNKFPNFYNGFSIDQLKAYKNNNVRDIHTLGGGGAHGHGRRVHPAHTRSSRGQKENQQDPGDITVKVDCPENPLSSLTVRVHSARGEDRNKSVRLDPRY